MRSRRPNGHQPPSTSERTGGKGVGYHFPIQDWQPSGKVCSSDSLTMPLMSQREARFSRLLTKENLSETVVSDTIVFTMPTACAI